MSNQIWANNQVQYKDQHVQYTMNFVRGAGGSDYTFPMEFYIDGNFVNVEVAAGTNPAAKGAAIGTMGSAVGFQLPAELRPSATTSAVCSISHDAAADGRIASAVSMSIQTNGTMTIYVLGSSVTGAYSSGTSFSYRRL